MYQHLHVPPPPFKKDSKIPPHVEQVVMIALAKDPEQRFASVQAFATALEQASQVSPRAPVSVGQSLVSPDAVTVLSQSFVPTEMVAPARQAEPQMPVAPAITSSGAMVGDDLAHTHINPDECILSPTDEHTDILPPSPSNSIEQLVQEGVRAQVGERNEEAFRIWQQVIATSGIAEEYRTNARNRIRELCPQMLPSRLEQAREASMQGRWQDEIRLWEDLLVLEPSAQYLASLPRLSLISGNNSLQSIQERLQVARQNNHSAGMYAGAQQYIHNRDSAAACRQLRMLWDDAPYYGDPADLAQIVGLPAPSNYEQALADEQVRLIQKQARQEQLRQERERKKQAIEKHKRNKRILVAGGIGGGVVGGGVAVGIAATTTVTTTAASLILEHFGWKCFYCGGTTTAASLIVGAIAGAIVGAIVGAISLAVIRILAGGEALALSGWKEAGVVTIAGIIAGIIAVAGVAVAFNLSFAEMHVEVVDLVEAGNIAAAANLVLLAGLAVTVVVGVVAGAVIAGRIRKKS